MGVKTREDFFTLLEEGNSKGIPSKRIKRGGPQKPLLGFFWENCGGAPKNFAPLSPNIWGIHPMFKGSNKGAVNYPKLPQMVGKNS